MNRMRSGYGADPYASHGPSHAVGGQDRLASLSRTIESLEQRLAGMNADRMAQSYGAPQYAPPYGQTGPAGGYDQQSELDNLKATITRLTNQINARPPLPFAQPQMPPQQQMYAPQPPYMYQPQQQTPPPYMAPGWPNQMPSGNDFLAEAAQRKAMLNNQAANNQAAVMQARQLAEQQSQNASAMKDLSSKLDALHQDVTGLKYAVSATPKPEVHKAEIDRIASGIRALQQAPRIDDGAFDRLQDELSELRNSLRQDLRNTVHDEIAPAIQASLSTAARQDSWEGGYSDLATRLDRISEALEAVNRAAGSNGGGDSVTPKVELLAHQIDFLRSSVDDLPQTLAINRLEKQLQEMAKAFDKMTRDGAASSGSASAAPESMAAIQARLDEIARNLDESRKAPAAEGTPAADNVTPKVELLAHQIDFLRSSVDDLPQTLAIGRLEDRLHELAKAVETMAQNSAERGEQGGNNTDGLAAIENRLDEISRGLVAVSNLGPDHKPLDLTGVERLEQRMGDLTAMVESLKPKPEDAELAEARKAHELDQLATRLEQRISELKSAMENMSMNRSPDDGGPPRGSGELDALAARMEERINDLKVTMESMSHVAAGADMEQVSAFVDARLVELKEAVEQLPTNREAQELAEARTAHEFEQLAARMEARINELQKSLDELSSARGAQEIEELSARIAGLTERLGSFEKYAESGDLGSAGAIFAAPQDNSAIEHQLQQLAARLDEAVNANSSSSQIAALEAQIGHLANSLQSAPGAAPIDFGPMEARLNQIESQLTVNHDFSLQAAQHAAESVMQMMGPQSEDGQIAGALSEELKALQAALEGNENRTSDTFDAVNQTLQVVVERLGSIENAINNRGIGATAGQEFSPAEQNAFAASTAASFQAGEAMSAGREVADAPSVDPAAYLDQSDTAVVEDDHPLEPGVDVPESRAPQAPIPVMNPAQDAAKHGSSDRIDVVAAVRRAVQATQAEIDASKAEAAANASVEPQIRAKRKKAQSNSLMEKFRGGDRKPVIIAAAAAILLMLSVGGVALVGKNILYGNSAPQIAATDAATIDGSSNESGAGAASEIMAAAPADNAGDVRAADAQAPAPVSIEPVAAPAPVESDNPSDTAAADQPLPADDTAGQETEIAAADAGDDSDTVMINNEPVKTMEPLSAAAGQDDTAGDDAAAEKDEAGDAEGIKVAINVPPTIKPAALRAAAEGGDRVALYELGARYSEGRGVKRNLGEAANWFQKSADLGFAPAQYSLGSLYEKGLGVERDLDKAASLYEKAARKGNARAMHNLAVINAMGNGKEADLPTATKWFHDAANLGVKDSQFNLGILYGQGMGVPQNLVNSYKWFAIAARTGDADAANKRDEVANVMDAKDLEKARALVKDWNPATPQERVNRVSIPEEWRKEDSAETAAVDPRTMVKKVQALLNRAGYDVGKPDGLAGPRTTKAIIEFQKRANLPATGEIDPELVRMLEGTNT